MTGGRELETARLNRDTSAAGRLLIELPYPFRWEGFEDDAFPRRPCDYFEQVRW